MRPASSLVDQGLARAESANHAQNSESSAVMTMEG